MFKFNIKYLTPATLLFITEILIGVYMHDAIIRPYGGDFLVVILIYCAVKSFFDFPVIPSCFGVLLFAYITEVSQYFHLVYVLGLGGNKLARIIMGTGFSWVDMLAYTLGIGLVILIEKIRHSKYQLK